MIRRFTLTALLLILAPFISYVQAADQNYVAGKDYAVIEKPVRTRDASKVEVVEVFWYGCSHCYHFEPALNSWKGKLPADVDFWRSPAIWNAAMEVHAQAFYTAKALDILEKVHGALFTTLVVERKRLNNVDDIAALFANYGASKEDVEKTFKSFSVVSQVKQANARARSYKTSGTPEIIVNGKYRVTTRLAGGQAQMIQVINHLIEKERKLVAAK